MGHFCALLYVISLTKAVSCALPQVHTYRIDYSGSQSITHWGWELCYPCWISLCTPYLNISSFTEDAIHCLEVRTVSSPHYTVSRTGTLLSCQVDALTRNMGSTPTSFGEHLPRSGRGWAGDFETTHLNLNTWSQPPVDSPSHERLILS